MPVGPVAVLLLAAYPQSMYFNVPTVGAVDCQVQGIPPTFECLDEAGLPTVTVPLPAAERAYIWEASSAELIWVWGKRERRGRQEPRANETAARVEYYTMLIGAADGKMRPLLDAPIVTRPPGVLCVTRNLHRPPAVFANVTATPVDKASSSTQAFSVSLWRWTGRTVEGPELHSPVVAVSWRAALESLGVSDCLQVYLGQ